MTFTVERGKHDREFESYTDADDSGNENEVDFIAVCLGPLSQRACFPPPPEIMF